MDLIILTDGMYHLVEVTKEMMTDMMLFNKDQINFFDLCDIIRLAYNVSGLPYQRSCNE